MAIQSFRELVVWQKAMDLAEVVYRSTSSFPIDERYGLTAIAPCCVSIPRQYRRRPGEGDQGRVHSISGSRSQLASGTRDAASAREESRIPSRQRTASGYGLARRGWTPFDRTQEVVIRANNSVRFSVLVLNYPPFTIHYPLSLRSPHRHVHTRLQRRCVIHRWVDAQGLAAGRDLLAVALKKASR